MVHFLRTQAKSKQSSICWDLNRQSMNNPERCVFFSLCRLAGIVQRYLSLCERKIERDGGIGGVGIHPSPKYYVVVKNICNARRYFGKYLKKANTRLTFSWAFVNRFTLHIIWRRVREDLCYCVMLFLPNYVNLFRSYIHFYISR